MILVNLVKGLKLNKSSRKPTSKTKNEGKTIKQTKFRSILKLNMKIAAKIFIVIVENKVTPPDFKTPFFCFFLGWSGKS